ncbi:hypothetical protein [Pedobacter sp. UC225_65]|uniref:hypothetical protein n=1 Tax=Pedobacter sp. UC225_65 TaxID=3350173 RepID=UPI00366BC1E2
MKSKSRYLLAAFLSVAIWGFFSIPLRNLKAFPSEEILYYRIFTSLIVIWIAILLFRRKYLKQDIQYFRSALPREKKIDCLADHWCNHLTYLKLVYIYLCS